MNTLFEHLLNILPLLLTISLVMGALLAINWFLLGRRPDIGSERRLPRQLTLLLLTLTGIVIIAIALPVEESTRNQVIALIGLLASGVVAFSSTTVIANLMAGIMLRVNQPFKTGDFIRVGEFFGRVSERGLLETEIQSEQRELIALPNTFLISNPVTAISSSGAIVSAGLSLGYDIHHAKIQSLLIAAAEQIGLEDPFVQIIELGDFSVSYRVSGLLKDVKSLLTTKSNLHRAILDVLHQDNVEIVSPAFMNQRQIDRTQIIPQSLNHPVAKAESTAEALVFDKAELAEQQELARKQLREELDALVEEAKSATAADKTGLNDVITLKRQQLADFESQVKTAKSEADSSK